MVQDPLRRKTLKTLSWLAGGSALIGPSRVFAQDDIWDCIVIGAGAAGITAARDLIEQGYRVLLLEGSQRIGGRIDTRHLNFGQQQYPVDFGAELIHRDVGSVPLWTEVERYKLSYQKVSKYSGGRIKWPHIGGLSSVNSAVFAQPGLDIKLSAINELAFLNQDISDFYQNHQQYIATDKIRFQSYDISPNGWIRRQQKRYQAYRGEYVRDMVRMFLKGHGEDWENRLENRKQKVSVLGFGYDRIAEQSAEEFSFKLQGGYRSLLDPMLSLIGSRLRLGHAVDTIHRQQGGGMLIRGRAPEGAFSLKAKTIICTSSIGYLKSKQGQRMLKAADLNPKFQDALKYLHHGSHGKVFVELKQKIYDDKTTMIHSPTKIRSMGKTWFVQNQTPAGITNLYLRDDADDRINAMTQEDLETSVSKDLKSFFDKDNFFSLDEWREKAIGRVIAKRWAFDPWSKGCNSYLTLNKSVRDMTVAEARPQLASPEYGPLFFAGEATSTREETQASTVHGAHASGKRAACFASEYLKGTSNREMRDYWLERWDELTAESRFLRKAIKRLEV